MDFKELIAGRYSVRQFKADKVSEEQLAQLLEAARLAPTAKNAQDFFIYALQSEEGMKIANDCSPCIYGAPLTLVFCCDRQQGIEIPINKVDFPLTDAVIVMTHVMLAAASMGLGSCWVGYFNEEKTRAALNMPKNLQPVGFLPVGYPDMAPGPSHEASKDLSELYKVL